MTTQLNTISFDAVDVYRGCQALAASAVARIFVSADINSSDVRESRKRLAEGDFLGFEESEKFIASVLNASA